MKKICIAALVFLLVLSFVGGLGKPALADDRITFGVRAYTQTAGTKGGTIIMTVSIQNPTEREIDWIDFRVNTSEPYYEHWTGTDGVPPYCNRTNRLEVYFAPEDLNKDKFLQLAINYDSDSNPDDIKMTTIRINSIAEVISVSASSDPDGGPFIVGNAVFATHRLTNNADYIVEDIVVQCLMTNESGERIADTGPTNIEILDGGASVGIPIGTEFSKADKEYVQVSYALAYTYLGMRYAITDETIFMPVMHPDFTAELSAPFYNADYGTMTDLKLRLTNTGNVGFGSFYIENPEGVHVANGEALGAGESVDIPIPFLFFDYDEWDMRYIIMGDFGYGDHKEESNTIHMACNPASTASPSSSASTTASAAPSAMASAEPSDAFADDEAALANESDTDVVIEPETVSEEAGKKMNDNLALYIIIGILGLFVVAACITVPILLYKNKKKDTVKRKDSL